MQTNEHGQGVGELVEGWSPRSMPGGVTLTSAHVTAEPIGEQHSEPLYAAVCGLQRTTAANEAFHLLLRHAFDDLGYRRVEWKCDALNTPSARAAVRFGFTFEGRFRQHMVTNGRNRDTDWFSMLDGEWPEVRARHERWQAPENFDPQGRQARRLENA